MITDELLFRYLNQETSKKENRQVSDWLSRHPDNGLRVTQLREMLESTDQVITDEELANDWASVDYRLQTSVPVLHIRHRFPLQLARVAAVILVLIGSGLFWLYQSGTHIIRNRELVTKSVFLPDGTQVDLGPGSKLVYGGEFMEGTRIIRLTGEACFDVTSDPEHPFTVMAGDARIKVTGTRFVVNAYPRSKEVEVSVKSGIVLFYNSDTMDKNSFRMGLLAGEKGIFYPAQNRMDKTIDPYFHTTP